MDWNYLVIIDFVAQSALSYHFIQVWSLKSSLNLIACIYTLENETKIIFNSGPI